MQGFRVATGVTRSLRREVHYQFLFASHELTFTNDENLIFEVNPMVMQNVAGKRGRSKPIDISESLTKYEIQPNFMNFEISDGVIY